MGAWASKWTFRKKCAIWAAIVHCAVAGFGPELDCGLRHASSPLIGKQF